MCSACNVFWIDKDAMHEMIKKFVDCTDRKEGAWNILTERVTE